MKEIQLKKIYTSNKITMTYQEMDHMQMPIVLKQLILYIDSTIYQ